MSEERTKGERKVIKILPTPLDTNKFFWDQGSFSVPLKQRVNRIRNFAICTEKVSFNIASEASYVYILSGQKLIKNAKNDPFWRVFENLKLAVKQCYQTCQL